MAMRKRLMEGESLAVSGECVITAVRNCTIDIQADKSVSIDSLSWSVHDPSGYLTALGDDMQTYWLDDDGASYYESGSDVERRVYEGDRAKAFCEIHNMHRGK